MSNLKIVPKTLFEIIKEVLLKHEDSNLSSETARDKIADDICVEYYDEISLSSEEEYIYSEESMHRIDEESQQASDEL